LLSTPATPTTTAARRMTNPMRMIMVTPVDHLVEVTPVNAAGEPMSMPNP
jgi:hypothetical protein